MLIALIIGLTVGGIRSLLLVYYDSDSDRGSFPTQDKFEKALLTTRLEGLKDEKFVDLALIRWAGGDTPNRFVVTGRKMGGRAKVMADGIPHDTDLPYRFVADYPYKFKRDPKAKITPITPDFMERLGSFCEKLKIKPADPPNSVLDYLRYLRETRQIQFAYQWWKQPRPMMIFCTLGSIVLVGLIWPTLVNLMAYGSIFRPQEQKSAFRRSQTPAQVKPKPTVTKEDMARLLEMEAQLEEKLKGTVSLTPVVQPQDKSETPIRKLAATGPEAKSVEKTEEEKDFERRQGDYYPVAHGGKKKEQ